MKVTPTDRKTIEYLGFVEDLVKAGNQKVARRYLNKMVKTKKDYQKSLALLLLITSYLIDRNNAELNRHLAALLQLLRKDYDSYKISRDKWNFKGIRHVISTRNFDVNAKFILNTLIDLLQGNIDKNNLSIIGSK
jgi:hypothetical protein